MSQHAQRTQTGPGRAVITVGWLLTGAAMAGVAYLVTGIRAVPLDAVDLRMAVGAGLGVALSMMTAARTMDLHVTRETIRRRIERNARTAERAAAERARNTGTWRGDGEGQSLTVRYDPARGRYLVQGWLGERYLDREVPWTALLTLRVMLQRFEEDGSLEPLDDEGTRSIRAWLGLAQAFGPHDPDPVATQPLPVVVPVVSSEQTEGRKLRPSGTAEPEIV